MNPARTRQIVIEHDPNQQPASRQDDQPARSGAEEPHVPDRSQPSPAVGAEGFDWDRVVSF